jgi:GMC oxidoreductase
LQFYFGGFLADCAVSGQVGELNSQDRRSIQIFPAVLHPKSRGYITINSSDVREPPIIHANYLDEDHDINVLVDGIKFAIKLSKTSALRAYGMELDTTVVPGCGQFKFGSDVSDAHSFRLQKKKLTLQIIFHRTIGNVQSDKIPVLRTTKLEVVKWVRSMTI